MCSCERFEFDVTRLLRIMEMEIKKRLATNYTRYIRVRRGTSRTRIYIRIETRIVVPLIPRFVFYSIVLSIAAFDTR